MPEQFGLPVCRTPGWAFAVLHTLLYAAAASQNQSSKHPSLHHHGTTAAAGGARSLLLDPVAATPLAALCAAAVVAAVDWPSHCCCCCCCWCHSSHDCWQQGLLRCCGSILVCCHWVLLCCCSPVIPGRWSLAAAPQRVSAVAAAEARKLHAVHLGCRRSLGPDAGTDSKVRLLSPFASRGQVWLGCCCHMHVGTRCMCKSAS